VLTRGGPVFVAIALALATIAWAQSSGSTEEPHAVAAGDRDSAASEGDRKAAAQPARTHAAAVGDLLISGVDGPRASAALRGRLRRGEVAGVILLGPSIVSRTQVSALTASLRSAAREGGQPPPLVMVDQEGGDVRRLAWAHPRASARDLGHLALGEVEREGVATGRDLFVRGVNIDLAPVVDVRTNAANFLGSRTFASDAAAVARNACRFAAGLRHAGVVATLKHFPGLGAAGSTNTDLAPVMIDRPLAALRGDWLAYRSCGRLPGTLTMVSNASYPVLTGTLPAVLSARTYAALRGAGISGPVVTDALGAAALERQRDVAVRAVEAGADLLLYTDERGARVAHAALSAALRDGRISRATLRARAAGVRALRASVAR
jgi:beta-N-acetylhexosaminidase